MSIELMFSTNIRKAAILIEESEVNPFIDHRDTRYLIHIDRILGTVIWTPFDIPSQELIGLNSYAYPFASHNMLFDAILGPRSKNSPQTAIVTTWQFFTEINNEPGSVNP